MRCRKCGSEMIIDYSRVLTSLPPKYKATCDRCGNVEYPDCSECYDEVHYEAIYS